ncbi:hypothetical protein VitviT2T_028448 [Vitis vinifera]|uniref:Transposase-associated domain-containing protein n=1 Tax=Vitis vinifera TaxID=29760 RepID=A0ABY9DVG0_VITVI|nr:hypothetical protein VitviT2T_028448 [Vitis vinifera]
MNRSWMSKDRRSKEYEDGVENFISFAIKNSANQNSIKCPYLQCGNLIFNTPQKIKERLFFYGIDQSYHTWFWHGEVALSSGPPTTRVECFDRIHIGNVDHTVEMVEVAQENCKANPKLFEMLLEDAEKPLYPDCKNFTKLSALVKLYNLKGRYGWSDKNFSELLSLLGDMLLINNELSLSMYEAKKKKKKIECIGNGICKNTCMSQ